MVKTAHYMHQFSYGPILLLLQYFGYPSGAFASYKDYLLIAHKAKLE